MPRHIPPEPPALDRPGAGIPRLQRWIARYYHLPRIFKRMSAEQALEKWRRYGDKLLGSLDGLDAEALGTRVLVDPMPVLEDSSRWWSAAMTMEHLMVVGRQIATAVVTLSRGEIPDGDNDPALVKPTGEAPATEVLSAFRAFLDTYPQTIRGAVFPLRTDVRFPHPWFGPKTAHQWLCISALHQGLHRQQVKAIVARIRERG